MKYIFGRDFACQTAADKTFNVINHIALTMLLAVVLYPLYFIVIASFSDPNEVAAAHISFYIKGFFFNPFALLSKVKIRLKLFLVSHFKEGQAGICPQVTFHLHYNLYDS